MTTPTDCKYTREHEWLKSEADGMRIGITDYAQQELGDVVFVDLPEVGTEVKQGESFATVESVKAVSDVYAPIDGRVAAINESLLVSPQLINQSPYAEGWLIALTPVDESQTDSLMDAASYDRFVGEVAK